MGRQQRRLFIRDRVSVKAARILELGALNSPTFPERDSYYLDWFSREELIESLRDHPNRAPETILEVDYVVKKKRFAEAVLPDQFEVLIASHVIEHIADPIAWLQQLRQLVTDRGSLFLTVPDRRYTFDYLRPVSTVAQLLRAYDEDLQMPSRWQMLDSIFYHRPIKAADVWAGDLTKLDRPPRYSIDEALDRSLLAEKEYVDTHCHVFTTDSFQQLMNDLGPVTGWRVEDTEDVTEGQNEFHAWLRPI